MANRFIIPTTTTFNKGASDVDIITSYSPTTEAEKVLARMVALNDTERNAIINFVESMQDQMYWEKVDEVFCFALNSADAATGFKLKTGTVSGATHTIKEGYSFDGVNDYFDTDWNPTNDADNYKLKDALMGVYIFDNRNTTEEDMVMGANDLVSRVELRDDFNLELQYSINGNFVRTGPKIVDKDFVVITRDSMEEPAYINGSLFNSGSEQTEELFPDRSIYVGGRNRVADFRNWDGTASFWIVGSQDGIFAPTLNNIVETFLNDLGVATV